MATTLFQAQPYDPRKERRRRNIILISVGSIIVIAALLWFFRFWPYEHRVNLFFDALQKQQYEQAYGVWVNDANWKQYPQQYALYPYGSFYLDWGPGGEWGLIKSYHVDGAVTPKGGGTGVVVGITVNQRSEQCHIWVEKKDKRLAFSPY